MRWVEQVREAKVSGGLPPGAVLGDLKRASVGAPASGPEVRTVALRVRRPSGNSDLRTGLAAPAGARFRFAVDLPKRAELRFALGQVAPKEAGGKLRFSLRAGNSNLESVTWSEELVADPAGEWQERTVDLSSLGRGRAVVELASDGEAGLVGVWATPEIVTAKARHQRFNLILISLDTVRADHLSAWGYSRPTSPELARFAAGGTRFAWAISQAPWTRPSHNAMLTGLHPTSLQGLVRRPLADALWRAGYRTMASTGGGQVDAAFGFDTGFERYAVEDWLAAPGRTADELSRPAGRPFFLFLHTFEPHDPYVDRRFAGPPPDPRYADGFSNAIWLRRGQRMDAEEKRYVEALYDGDLAHTDEQLGKLFARLEANGRLDDTIVVVTSDHGEQFWEHGSWRHGTNLYDHQTHVPLVIRLPPKLRASLERGSGSRMPSTVDDQVRSIDIYPTVLDLLGVPLPGAVHGRSLVPLLAGRAMPPVEAFSENTHAHIWERKSLRSARTKFIRTFSVDGRRDPGEREFQLFDLRDDPREQNDLSQRFPEAVAALAARIDELRRGESGQRDEAVPEGIDEELRRQLEALGYLSPSAKGAKKPPPDS